MIWINAIQHVLSACGKVSSNISNIGIVFFSTFLVKFSHGVVSKIPFCSKLVFIHWINENWICCIYYAVKIRIKKENYLCNIAVGILESYLKLDIVFIEMFQYMFLVNGAKVLIFVIRSHWIILALSCSGYFYFSHATIP